jgi:precorrin-8X/cobalt-precorrin-8 methylmutase
MPLAYEKEPARIYRQSFETIRREANLGGLSQPEAAIAVRVIHACGMTDVVEDLVFGGDVAGGCRAALAGRRPVFTDVEMVRAAIAVGKLPKSVAVRCTLNLPETAVRARELETTRSAAGVLAWRDELDGAVVVIGNAPTALFALLELIDAGASRPAAVFAFPVGFVGAAESKDELIANPRGLNFVTVRGRRGGSAMAAAAFNAVGIGVDDQ